MLSLSLSIFYALPQNLLHSTDAPLPEYKTQSLKKSRLILSHYGMFKGCWDWLILVATIYIAVAVPYNASFVKNYERLTMPSDVIVEALFIIGESLGSKVTLKNVIEYKDILSFHKECFGKYNPSCIIVSPSLS